MAARAPVGLILQSSSYTALFLLIELFTPLFDAVVFPHGVWEPHVTAEVGAVKKCFFILSFSLSFFHLWICLTEALDLLRVFLAHHVGSMLKCQPRNAARIGKYEFRGMEL